MADKQTPRVETDEDGNKLSLDIIKDLGGNKVLYQLDLSANTPILAKSSHESYPICWASQNVFPYTGYRLLTSPLFASEYSIKSIDPLPRPPCLQCFSPPPKNGIFPLIIILKTT